MVSPAITMARLLTIAFSTQIVNNKSKIVNDLLLEPFHKAFNGQPVAVFDALRRDSLEIFVCAVLEINEHPVA